MRSNALSAAPDDAQDAPSPSVMNRTAPVQSESCAAEKTLDRPGGTTFDAGISGMAGPADVVPPVM